MKINLFEKTFHWAPNDELFSKRCIVRSLLLAVLAVGVAIRITVYCANRSLWLDEAALVQGISHISWSTILGPLEGHQQAPLIFIVLEKFILSLFGDSEYWLRLFPLLCGTGLPVVAAFFMYRRFSFRVTLFTVLFLCVSPKFVYFSSEVKQYSWESLVALVILIIGYTSVPKIKNSLMYTIFFSIGGSLSLWSSISGFFCLCGTAAIIIREYWKERTCKNLLAPAIIFTCWALSLVAEYLIVFSRMISDSVLRSSWCVRSILPTTLSTVRGEIETLILAFNNPAGFSCKGLAVFLCVLGMISILLKKDMKLLFATAIPFVAVFLTFGRYPFSDRLILFLFPGIFIIIGEGLDFITRALPRAKISFFIFGLAALSFFPILETRYYVLHPWHEEIKEGIEYLINHRKKDDTILVYYATMPAFKHYAGKYGITEEDYSGVFSPRNELQKYQEQLVSLACDKPVWVVFTHVHEDEMEKMNKTLQAKRNLIYAFVGNKCWTYCWGRCSEP